MSFVDKKYLDYCISKKWEILLSVISTISIALLVRYRIHQTYWFLLLLAPPLFMFFVYVKERYYFFNRLIFAFSLFFATVFTLSTGIYRENLEYKPNLLLVTLLFLGLLVISYFSLLLLNALSQHSYKDKTELVWSKRHFVLIWSLGFLSWAPYLLAFAPAIMSADSIDQWAQATGQVKLYNHHPIFHTLLIKLTTFIGDTPLAYSLLQMVLMASGFTFILYWMYQRGIAKKWLLVFSIFYFIHPLNAVYSITMWKDVLFSMVLGLLTVSIAEIVIFQKRRIKRSWLLFFFIMTFLTMALRNNGIYIIFLLLLVVVVLEKMHRKALAIITISSILIYMIIVGPVFGIYKIQKSSFKESLGIPIQQVARTVYLEGEVSETDKKTIAEILPLDTIKKKYTEAGVDPIKFDKDFDIKPLEENKSEYLKLWFRLLKDNPRVYVTAYLEATRGFWDPFHRNWSALYEIIPNRFGVKEVRIFPGYSDDLQFLADKSSYVAPFYLTWSATVVNYIILALALVIILKGRLNYLLIVIPVFANWFSLMIATPIQSSTRYIYSSFIVLPIIIYVVFFTNDNKK